MPPTATTPPSDDTPHATPRKRRRRRSTGTQVDGVSSRPAEPDFLTMTFQLGQQQERLSQHDTLFKQHDQRISSLERIAVETKDHLDAQDERAEERERVAAARAEERERIAAERNDALRATIAGLVERLDTEDATRKARTDETLRRVTSLQTWTKGFLGTAAGGALYYIGLQTWPRVLTGDVRNAPTLAFAAIVAALVVAWFVAGHIRSRAARP